MRATCEHCGAHYRIPNEKIGGKRLRVTCKKCGEKFTVVGPHRRPKDTMGAITDGPEVPLEHAYSEENPKPPPLLPTQVARKIWRIGTGNGEQNGPYSEEELGQLLSTIPEEVQLVWRPGFKKWYKPGEVEELRKFTNIPSLEPSLSSVDSEGVEIPRSPVEEKGSQPDSADGDGSFNLQVGITRLLSGLFTFVVGFIVVVWVIDFLSDALYPDMPKIVVVGRLSNTVSFKECKVESDVTIRCQMTNYGNFSKVFGSIFFIAYNEKGVKLTDGPVMIPTLAKGQTGKAEMLIFNLDEVSKIEIVVQ